MSPSQVIERRSRRRRIDVAPFCFQEGSLGWPTCPVVGGRRVGGFPGDDELPGLGAVEREGWD